MKLFLLSILFFSFNTNASVVLDFDMNEDFETIEANNSFDLVDSATLKTKERTSVINMKIGPGATVAKLELNMTNIFLNTGKNASEIVDILTNEKFFNLMAEKVRSTESGSAYQNTVKIGTPSSYTLTTSAWGYKELVMKVKINAGTSKVVCNRNIQKNNSITVECKKDLHHKGTDELLQNTWSSLTCTQSNEALVTCINKIVVEPREFSLFTKYLSAHEIAFRTGIRAIRTNMGLSGLVRGQSVANAYDSYNRSDLEMKITSFIETFEDNKNSTLNFKY